MVKNLPPPATGQKLYRDDALAGFGVRVSQGGTKTFTLVLGRDRQFVSIGRYPTVGLADARTEAKRMLAERTLGKHRPPRMAASQALDRFFTEKTAKNKRSSIQAAKWVINAHFPKLLKKELADTGLTTLRM